jgi:hypothetical protein
VSSITRVPTPSGKPGDLRTLSPVRERCEKRTGKLREKCQIEMKILTLEQLGKCPKFREI